MEHGRRNQAGRAARTACRRNWRALGDNENLPEVAVYDNTIRSELDELNALLQKRHDVQPFVQRRNLISA